MASPCFPSAVVLQFTYSVQEVINWVRSKALDTINIPPWVEALGATARFLLTQTSTREHTLSPHDGEDGTQPFRTHMDASTLVNVCEEVNFGKHFGKS